MGAPVTAWVIPSRKVAGPIRPVTPGPLQVDIATLYDAVHQQITVEGVGYLHSIGERQGGAEAPSLYPDTWLAQGSVRIGVRPVRNS